MCEDFNNELKRVLAWVERTYGHGLRLLCEAQFEKRKLSAGGAGTFDPYQVFEEVYTASNGAASPGHAQFAPSKFYGNVTIKRRT